MANCPNCRQAISPGEDICENCGAVLSASTLVASQARLLAAPPPTTAPPGSPGICPACHTPLATDEDICENCGRMLSATVISTPLARTTSPQAPPARTSVPVLASCPRCSKQRTADARFCNGCGLRFSDLDVATSSQVPPAPSSLCVGELLNGRYRITREIGEGGMGAVLLAEDQLLKRLVVMKALLSEDDPDLIAQSIKEREFLAAIKHANIVSIYDFIAQSQRGYIVMEYVQGKTLDQIMQEQGRPFDVPEAITYIQGVLPAFTYLAKLGLVYCDFKPQNVMLEVLKDGSKVVKLVDLGTVIKYEPHPADVYGTHGFYAPEAVKSPSAETDLYAICRTLAFLVTDMDLARPIFGLPSIEAYQAFREYPMLYRLLARGTHPNPQRRFHSAEQLGDQLAGVLRQIVGGQLDQPPISRLFLSGMLTTTGKLGLRCEAALEENDPACTLLQAGDRALRSGNFPGALGFYQQARRRNRKSIDAHLRQAEVLIEQQEMEKAQTAIEKARTLDPGNWKVTWYTARLCEARGLLRAAADHYNELVAELPGELAPQQALARVYAGTQQFARAVDLYQRVLKADPGNADVALGAADALLKEHRWQEAIQMLQGVSEASARYVEAQLLLCQAALNAASSVHPQDIKPAVEAIQALAGKTEDPRYYLTRGDIYSQLSFMARQHRLPDTMVIPGVPARTGRNLGAVAEASYAQYLRSVPHAAGREAIVRKKLAVAPWRWW
jgi:serine/threonine-protein kinase PknG